VFLGDSLTEGVGSKRISHVTELAKQLRASEFRLRPIDARNGYVDFNVAGLMNVGGQQPDLWLWNLGCEGKTIESDFEWLPLIGALRPELIVVFRGTLESIVRPAMLRDGAWPWWVPRSWRTYSAMDPRCYFSTSSWRKAKQTSVDALKQKARMKLLKLQAGKPLMELEKLVRYQRELLQQLRTLGARVLVLGLLPIGEARFPDSPAYFRTVNTKLKEVADTEGAEFFDWASLLPAKTELFYRDSLHPNEAGARALAEILRQAL
jgi:GDSL-like lipase/acylhydrolase family protein